MATKTRESTLTLTSETVLNHCHWGWYHSVRAANDQHERIRNQQYRSQSNCKADKNNDRCFVQKLVAFTARLRIHLRSQRSTEFSFLGLWVSCAWQHRPNDKRSKNSIPSSTLEPARFARSRPVPRSLSACSVIFHFRIIGRRKSSTQRGEPQTAKTTAATTTTSSRSYRTSSSRAS